MRLFLFFFFSITLVNAQSDFEDIEDNFEDFAELTREQIYSHINKSTFITGESIWFKTYVLSKDNMELSTKTANIYCVLYDNENRPIKKKMIMGFNGVANGEFAIDSTFTSGEYTLKTYTNWSRNFQDEYVHHESKIKIINPQEKEFDKPLKTNNLIDVQLLPESGHLLANTTNRVGIIAKDSLGKAVKNLRVTLYEDGKELSEVELNHLGTNIFNVSPKSASKYKATYYYNNNKYEVKIPTVESQGLLLQIKETDSDVEVYVKTNTQTLAQAINKPFKLTIHNSVDMLGYDFLFQDKPTQLFKFSKKDLFPGINIFTLFNSSGEAIAERMSFNFEGLNISSSSSYDAKKQKDSIDIKIAINSISKDKLQSLSASVLPAETKSYNHNSNILSSILLSPYLKGPIENANYFFNDINSTKIKELDQLLLTQGWSRYDWNTIFNNQPEMTYDFEYGVDYKLSSNSKREETFLVYPNYNTKSELIDVKPNDFVDKIGFFPMDGELLRIGQVQKNKKVGEASLVVNFTTNSIPEFNNISNSISIEQGNQAANQGYNITPLVGLDKVQQLDEVKLVKIKEYTRIEKLQNKTIGKIHEFDEKMKRRYRTFAQFISSHGYLVETTKEIRGENSGGISLFRIETRSPVSINGTKEPRIFLDGVYLVDYNFLNEFSMRNVDYVEINRGGIGEGLRASAGVIRIYTDPSKRPEVKSKIAFTEYKIPLTFSTPKKFYTPRFGSNNSQFFKDYGTIDWQPNLKVENGFINMKIQNIGQPVNIYLEGVVNSDSLISEIITVN
ncbi:hypothetical protein [uncultured Winogradskyella sp.]|uniref:hypothetical protein n=1 Tax=uncultured Winogradskyella sp. TaxID=395353 RepID=UPI00261B0559|nr:hypothetical protein [uncultured Winogradskyella sp.]